MRRHIVLLSPPWYPVPPRGYGGIELVVALLARELRRRHGCAVTLVGAAGSEEGALELAPACWRADLGQDPQRLRELTYASRIVRLLRDLDGVTAIHDHCFFGTLLAATMLDVAPVLHTVHGLIREPEITFLDSLPLMPGLVAISASQRSGAPGLSWAGVVHNAVDTDELMIARPADKQPYILCLARIAAEKGQHLAIEVARRAGIRLVLAGKVDSHPDGDAYFRSHVEPHIDGDRVVYVSNVAGVEKARLLRDAAALVAPIQWDEPFGLAVVEAMASGTPAISFARGAAPELIDHGLSGLLVSGVDEMVDAVGRLGEFDPAACAAAARRRFSPAAMSDGYMDVYGDAARARRTGSITLEGTRASAVLN